MVLQYCKGRCGGKEVLRSSVFYSEMDNGFVASLGKHLILFLRKKNIPDNRLTS